MGVLTTKVLESASSVPQGEFQHSDPTSGESSLGPLCLLIFNFQPHSWPHTTCTKAASKWIQGSSVLTVSGCPLLRWTGGRQNAPPPPACFCSPLPITGSVKSKGLWRTRPGLLSLKTQIPPPQRGPRQQRFSLKVFISWSSSLHNSPRSGSGSVPVEWSWEGDFLEAVC